MEPTMINVGHHNVKAVGHDPETNTLHVEFQSGSQYEYPGQCSATAFSELLKAANIGKHLHANYIKDNKNYKKKVKTPQKDEA